MGEPPIICLEGPSAVGKSAVAQHLEGRFGFVRIAEVNELFQRTVPGSPRWYFDRQVERYAMAHASVQGGRAAVLDGDPFQPLWYNWIYPEFGPVTDAVHFYSDAIAYGRIAFPDCYIVLAAQPEALRERKNADQTRRRANFERHLQMIEAQHRYFTALRDAAGVDVRFLDNVRTEDTAQHVADLSARPNSKSADALVTIAAWLGTQRAAGPA